MRISLFMQTKRQWLRVWWGWPQEAYCIRQRLRWWKEPLWQWGRQPSTLRWLGGWGVRQRPSSEEEEGSASVWFGTVRQWEQEESVRIRWWVQGRFTCRSIRQRIRSWIRQWGLPKALWQWVRAGGVQQWWRKWLKSQATDFALHWNVDLLLWKAGICLLSFWSFD